MQKVVLSLLASIIISYYFISVYLSYILLAGLIYFILKKLYILGSTSFSVRSLKNFTFYYKKVVGPYKNTGKNFEEACKILSKFGLKNNGFPYSTLGMYFDDPKKVKEEECRAAVGIKFMHSTDKDVFSTELADFLTEQGFKKIEIETTTYCSSKFEIVHKMFIIFAIFRFYKDLERAFVEKNELNKIWGIKSGENRVPEFNCIMEEYREEYLEFFIPTRKIEKFDIWNK